MSLRREYQGQKHSVLSVWRFLHDLALSAFLGCLQSRTRFASLSGLTARCCATSIHPCLEGSASFAAVSAGCRLCRLCRLDLHLNTRSVGDVQDGTEHAVGR